MIIDAHQHVWDFGRAEYPWLGEALHPIDRTIGMEEVLPAFARTGVTASVLVQAADNAEDTDHMLEVAARHPQVVAVVGYAPLDRPEEAAAQLERRLRDPLFAGVRNLIHDQQDPDHILRDDVDEGLGLLERAGLPFDYVAVLPRHLEHVPLLGERHPSLRIVIDHLGKPPIGEPDAEPWRSLLARAAENPNVLAKVSGLYPGAEPAAWTVDTIRPGVDHALEVFGADRLMYGGDWPMSILAGGYERVWAGLERVFSGWSAAERDAVLWRTAVAAYRIDERRLARAAAEEAS